jgi:hypothetical protein
MPPDVPMSRRAALKLTAWGGAGLVAGACTGGVGPRTTNASVGPTTPEPAPLPGRPANVRVSQDEFVAHAEPCLAVNPRDPRNLLGACIAHEDEGGTQIAAYASFDAGASWRSLGGLEDSGNGRDPTARLEFGRSGDGGRSFQAPRAIDTLRGPKEANFASPMVAAGHDGTIHVVYGVWPPLPTALPRPEFPAPIRVISSTDRGQTWGRPVELGTGVMEIRVRPDTNGLGLPTVVAHRYRHLAAAAFVVRQPGAPSADIAVCLSRDRGRTWTAPRRVPRASDDTVYLQPQLAIDEAGNLALSAFAYRRGSIDVVVFAAEPATARFGRPARVTSRPFDPAQGTLSGKHGAWWIGDYQGLASAAGSAHPFWNDPRGGRLEIFTARV